MRADNPFKVDQKGSIAWLTFNRPDKRNAMDFRFFEALTEHMAEFDSNPEIRVVAIKAEGKSFTAGTDLHEVASMVSGRAADERDLMRIQIAKLQSGITAVEQCRKP